MLDEVVTALREGLREDLVAVVLFGSHARGEATETSDWDLLVIARQLPGPPLERHFYVKKLLPVSWRGRVAVLGETVEEFESELPPLYLDIALDGVVLYDTDKFVSTRLAFVRRLIEQKGLYRRRLGRDLVWQWRRFPGFNWSLEWDMPHDRT